MAALQVRDCPAELSAALKARADANHRSIAGEVLSILEQHLSATDGSDGPALVAGSFSTPAVGAPREAREAREAHEAAGASSRYAQAQVNRQKRKEAFDALSALPGFSLPLGCESARQLIQQGQREWSEPCSC